MNKATKMKQQLLSLMNFGKKLPLVFKSIKNIYRYGGYATLNIASIKYGEILKDKKVLITGGSTGIGLSIAKKCLQVGATVVITGRNDDKLKKAADEINNPRMKTLKWDISKINQIEEGIKNTKLMLEGDIDILINNAGIVNSLTFPNVTEEIWDKIYSINSKGLFFLTQTLCDQWMKENKVHLKKIINISSQGGFVGATYPYRMAKWDIAGLTQGLGIKLAPHGIIVNGVAPGIIATKMQPKYHSQGDNVFCSLNPLKRIGMPNEIAELVVFLMSDAANFIVGQTILCDGGYSIK
tara:strand:- start:9211 stop:10098 length:888 start_codon:yes stop_codon:yes gene_type:complete